jgi:hypothetical protein
MEPIGTAEWLDHEADRMEAAASAIYRIRDRLKAKRDALRRAGLEAAAEHVSSVEFLPLCKQAAKQAGFDLDEWPGFRFQHLAWAAARMAAARALREEAAARREADRSNEADYLSDLL